MRRIDLRPVPALLGVIGLLLCLVLFLSVEAFAAQRHQPAFSTLPVKTQVHFVIPSDSATTWTLELRSQGQIIATTGGTSGTLSIPLPAATLCRYQADVLTSGPKGNLSYYSGIAALSSCCPTTSTASSG
jgi:hypothetical protein